LAQPGYRLKTLVSSPREKPLWQHVLDWYGEVPDGTGGWFDRLHPFDPSSAIHGLQDLRDLGEEPSVVEFRNYLRTVRRHWGPPEKQMVDWWKHLLANPGYSPRVLRERMTQWRPHPYARAEWLIEQHGLSLSVPARLEAVMMRRAEHLVAAADHGTRQEYTDAWKLLTLARVSVRELRRLRFGWSIEDSDDSDQRRSSSRSGG
jgi:hypothetical protein